MGNQDGRSRVSCAISGRHQARHRDRTGQDLSGSGGKVVTVAREKVGAALGAPDAATIEEAERRLAVFPGFAK